MSKYSDEWMNWFHDQEIGILANLQCWELSEDPNRIRYSLTYSVNTFDVIAITIVSSKVLTALFRYLVLTSTEDNSYLILDFNANKEEISKKLTNCTPKTIILTTTVSRLEHEKVLVEVQRRVNCRVILGITCFHELETQVISTRLVISNSFSFHDVIEYISKLHESKKVDSQILTGFLQEFKNKIWLYKFSGNLCILPFVLLIYQQAGEITESRTDFLKNFWELVVYRLVIKVKKSLGVISISRGNIYTLLVTLVEESFTHARTGLSEPQIKKILKGWLKKIGLWSFVDQRVIIRTVWISVSDELSFFIYSKKRLFISPYLADYILCKGSIRSKLRSFPVPETVLMLAKKYNWHSMEVTLVDMMRYQYRPDIVETLIQKLPDRQSSREDINLVLCIGRVLMDANVNLIGQYVIRRIITLLDKITNPSSREDAKHLSLELQNRMVQ